MSKYVNINVASTLRKPNESVAKLAYLDSILPVSPELWSNIEQTATLCWQNPVKLSIAEKKKKSAWVGTIRHYSALYLNK